MSLLLAIFIHFREIKVAVLELNSTSSGYIITQIDFEFPDREATLVLKKEALKDIQDIYSISKRSIETASTSLENSLIKNDNWRANNNLTFAEVYTAMEKVVSALKNALISDARTIKKYKEFFKKNEYYEVNVQKNDEPQKLPDSFWKALSKNINYNADSIYLVIYYFKSLPWQLQKNIYSKKLFENAIEDSIPKKYSKVAAGSKIVSSGEIISQRHIDMMNAMKSYLKESKNLWSPLTILGSLIISIFIVILTGIYMKTRESDIYKSRKYKILLSAIVAFMMLLAKISEWILTLPKMQSIDFSNYPVIIPFATILISILIGHGKELFITFLLTVIFGIVLSFDNSQFIFMNLITSIIVITFFKKIKKRKEIFTICGKVLLAALLVLFTYKLYNNRLISIITLYDLIALCINVFTIAMLLTFLIPILESLFNVMTDMALMEYMNPTNELLKRLSIEASGTYQHSIAIGHMSEIASNAIGANGLFCRATTLYHDIGKLTTPQYYTENQLLLGDRAFDIHLLLTPVESAYVIKSHVQDGVNLAMQAKLPKQFIDVIRQHHGNTLIKYFYLKHLKLAKDDSKVDESIFRYPGPKPQTKEIAIIMITDSVESASRSLDNNEESAIRSLVSNIISDKINDGQLDDCPLTFNEISIIKEKLIEIVKATYHIRVKYPKDISHPDLSSPSP